MGFIYAPDVISFKLDRLDPIAGFKRLFSVKILIDTIKTILKFVAVISVTYVVIKQDFKSYIGFLQVDTGGIYEIGRYLLIKLGFSILTSFAIIAGADFAWEKFNFRKKLMLTKKEAKQELKEKEGNPEIRQRIRSIQREMSQKRMMASIPKADAIVTNPTHISVAIKYDVANMVAPTVIAKGADHLALKIRQIAKDNNVPIVENIILARTLYKTVKVGEIVPKTLYKAVAEILAFVYKIKKKRKALSE